MPDIAELINKHPVLFKDDNCEITLRFGKFEHDNGWYHIVDAMCESVIESCRNHYSRRPLWAKIYTSFDSHVSIKILQKTMKKRENWIAQKNLPLYYYPFPFSILNKWLGQLRKFISPPGYTCKGVVYPTIIISKEKMGSLRVSYDFKVKDKALNRTIAAVVSLAENMSRTTCEISGNVGSLCRSRSGHYKTLSEDVAAKLHYTKVSQTPVYPLI